MHVYIYMLMYMYIYICKMICKGVMMFKLKIGVFRLSVGSLDSAPFRRHSTEIRASHIDHFEFALCFPPSPYPSCQLDVPDYDMARQGGEEPWEMGHLFIPVRIKMFKDRFQVVQTQTLRNLGLIVGGFTAFSPPTGSPT